MKCVDAQLGVQSAFSLAGFPAKVLDKWGLFLRPHHLKHHNSLSKPHLLDNIRLALREKNTILKMLFLCHVS
jgi:hypothetical protein